jgi:hypothetical protein
MPPVSVRTHKRFTRIWVDGFDMSPTIKDAGSHGIAWDAPAAAAYADQIYNTSHGFSSIVAGPYQSFFDNTATYGFHTVFKDDPTAGRTVMVAYGNLVEPTSGSTMFMGKFEQSAYLAAEGDTWVASTLALSNSFQGALQYAKCFGSLLHGKTAETAVNTAVGIDDRGAATTLGGLFGYMLFSSNGTVTLKGQDAATNTNPSFADISGATSGVIDASSSPKFGIISLANTATIRRYLRWQLAFGTATTATFAIGLVRG